MADAGVDTPDYLTRALADSRDRVRWAKARSGGCGASDAASFSKLASAPGYARAKLFNPFEGNGYTAHGNAREPGMLAAYHLEQNFTLFHADGNRRHLATPDGLKIGPDGLFTVECKTSVKPLWKIPPAYQRQMWWAQYVLGADRTLFIWEEHAGYSPVDAEPSSQWFFRDDEQIEKLKIIADRVLEIMDAAAEFDEEMK